MQKVLHKKAIALLITVFFIMLITMSVGVGLTYVDNASKSMQSEQFTLQSSMIVEDVLKLLQTIDSSQINSTATLAKLLEQLSFFPPFESNGINIIIEINSARAKINPNALSTKSRLAAFKNYLMLKMVNTEYADMLWDVIGEIKEDMPYNSDIFSHKPYLFRDYITSHKHLLEINDSYMKKYHDNNLKNIDMEELFYISKNNNSTIDLNYANASAWELMLGCDEDRAEMLSANAGDYANYSDIGLSEEEIKALDKFQPSFFQQHVYVEIEIIQKNLSSAISFEYDIKEKKGSNFVFEI